jgi:beta-lactamase regulating signal transducer with metallopeptidase domain
MTHVNLVMTTLLNGIWQGTLVTAAMWVLLKLLPRLNPTTRFTVLWVTLMAAVALLVAPLTQGVFTPRAQTDSPAIPRISDPTEPSTAPGRTLEPRFIRQDKPASPDAGQGAAPKSEAQPVFEHAALAAPGQNAAAPGASVMAGIERPVIHIRSERFLAAFAITWMLLSLVMLSRLAFGFRKLQGLKADARPAPPEWQMQLARLRRTNGIGRQTQVLISSGIAAPMSLGFIHPAILVPRTLLDTLSNAELEHVVLHELAHLRRGDDWTNLAEKLITAIVPIHPAVYWIGRRMSIEREMACDDWVIAATGTAKPYAASLAKVAELTQWRGADILAAGATGNRSQLFARVHNMLNETRNAAPKLALGPLVAAIAAAGTLIYVGARAPQMIAFAQTSAHENSGSESTVPSAMQIPRAPLASSAAAVREARLSLPGRTAAQTPEASAPSPAVASSGPLERSGPVAPGSPLAATASTGAQQSSETHMEMTNRNGFTSQSVKIDGAIEFTDDDHDVKTLSPGGHFRMEERTGFSGHAYDVKADAGGNLTKTWLVDGSAKPLDSEGRAWLDRLLPQMIRESGIGAGPRVTRILRQGGPQAVITEIGLIHSDGSKRTYLEQLFAQATLNAAQLKDAAELIRKISSDGDKAQVLVDADQKYFTGDLRSYLFEAEESISSDGDKRRVLSDIVKKDAGSVDTLVNAARAAKHISSDGDKAEVLTEMAGPYRPGGGLDVAYFEAVRSVSSDGDHARVLSTMLAAHGDDRDTLARVLESAEKIGSDGDKARVLKEAVPRYSDDDLIRKAFFDAANSVSSDGDHQQVLVVLARREGIGAATLGGIAKSAQRISSDGDKARVLMELAGTNLEPARDDYFAAANSISSSGDHSQVLVTLLNKPGISSAMAIGAIQSAIRISSDGDVSRVLMDAADRYSKDPVVNAALRKAVESVHSDGVYRSVMSEIARQGGSN